MGLLGGRKRRGGRKGKAFFGALARTARRFYQWVKGKQSSSSSPPRAGTGTGRWEQSSSSSPSPSRVPKFGDWEQWDSEDGSGYHSRVSSGARSISSGRSSVASPPGPGAAAAAAEPRPAELGCVMNHHRRHPRPGSGRTKMRKFDRYMLASVRMRKLGTIRSPSGRMLRGTWVSDQALKVRVAIKVFHHLFDVNTKRHVSKELKGKLVLTHRNLLCPFGYGFRKRKLHLLYEYMVNGSLDQHLFTIKESSQQDQQQRDPLSWARRWSIINGVAAALLHLHSNGAVHGSVKSSNVLLDQEMTVRLGDFAYSRAPYTVSLSDMTSLGLPPECCPGPGALTFPVTEPTFAKDVFCFGSVILEVVCARKRSNGLVDWVQELYDSGNILGAVDKTLLLPAAGDSTTEEADDDEAADRSILLERVLLLGLACSHPDPSERPQMKDVVKMLAGSAPVPQLVPSASPLHSLQTDEFLERRAAIEWVAIFTESEPVPLKELGDGEAAAAAALEHQDVEIGVMNDQAAGDAQEVDVIQEQDVEAEAVVQEEIAALTITDGYQSDGALGLNASEFIFRAGCEDEHESTAHKRRAKRKRVTGGARAR